MQVGSFGYLSIMIKISFLLDMILIGQFLLNGWSSLLESQSHKMLLLETKKPLWIYYLIWAFHETISYRA